MVGDMRRILAPLMAASLLMLLPGAFSAAAAPVRTGAHQQVGVATCPNAPGYPTHPKAMVEVSTSIVRVGDSFEASGIDYCPDERVTLTIAGQYVATGHTDGDGDFDPRLDAPGPPGPKRLCGVGASGRRFDRDCLTIQVRAAGGTGAPASGPGGGTAFTGVQIALLGLLALVLVVGGVVATTLGRNRRPERA
jgi:hypothetical protein